MVATYQSTSGAGKAAMDELFNQTRGIYVNDPIKKEKFTKQIAFNVIPHIDVFMDDGSTKEEWKMVVETKKILDPGDQGDGDLRARADLHQPCRGGQHRVREAALRRRGAQHPARGAGRRRDRSAAPTKATSRRSRRAGEDLVFVSRIREDSTVEHGLSLWVVADNLRKGAALNAVQIAEELIKTYMRKAA